MKNENPSFLYEICRLILIWVKSFLQILLKVVGYTVFENQE